MRCEIGIAEWTTTAAFEWRRRRAAFKEVMEVVRLAVLGYVECKLDKAVC